MHRSEKSGMLVNPGTRLSQLYAYIYIYIGGGFIYFYFHPDPWGNDPI